ncbi:Ribose-5-phosphate isomerase [Thalictrum thalictroides]|uniref:Ribose-5-phosphate isomerase n=1 Tax=Thalictrum thalictroides TaxID=46969 RepID=A0A7J6V7V1_THATH|nr:Ribose-5-phosphate isomerase [Thalictrum thalictroides]
MAQDSKRSLKIIAGADSLGCTLKDALVTHLRSLNIEVEDIGTDKYYSIGGEVGRRVSAATITDNNNNNTEIRGLVACGTGVGVSIFANKFPGVYASTCISPDDAKNVRSISNANVLAVSGMVTDKETGIKILETWLNTPFKSPCPASDNAPWPTEIDSFFENSIEEMSKIGGGVIENQSESCAICNLAKNRDFKAVDIMPGGCMKIVRESPTSAIVRFEAGSVEPAHHHTFGHDVVVMKGSKKVWNLSKKESYDLSVGDFLFTPAGDIHRVKYFEDTEFFIRWDGHWDIFLDEDLNAAREAIAKE